MTNNGINNVHVFANQHKVRRTLIVADGDSCLGWWWWCSELTTTLLFRQVSTTYLEEEKWGCVRRERMTREGRKGREMASFRILNVRQGSTDDGKRYRLYYAVFVRASPETRALYGYLYCQDEKILLNCQSSIVLFCSIFSEKKSPYSRRRGNKSHSMKQIYNDSNRGRGKKK